MINIKLYLRKLSIWFESLAMRERWLIIVTGGALVVFILLTAISGIQDYVIETDTIAAQRQRDLAEFNRYARRYNQLTARLESLKTSFDQSTMTFEQVTSQIDKIIKDSVGDQSYDSYELKRKHDPKKLGDEYEKQDFTLTVNRFSLEQLVNLLFQLEEGTSPLFLGKVDVNKSGRKAEFRATLEIASIRKVEA